MKRYITLIIAASAIVATNQATAWSLNDIKQKIEDANQKIENARNKINASAPWHKSNSGSVNSYNNSGTSLSGDYQPDAYGLGTNADQYGRSFKWETRDGRTVSPIFNKDVKPNAYGPGVGMDSFGRAVHRKY